MLEAKGTARWETLSVEELGTSEDRKEASVSKENGTGKPSARIGSNAWGLLENIPLPGPESSQVTSHPLQKCPSHQLIEHQAGSHLALRTPSPALNLQQSINLPPRIIQRY